VCELGERLRRAREEKGLSLKEAAGRLALKASVLEALEACRFEELPEPPLARGYLRRYALLLGLDPEPLLALYPSTPEPPPSPPAKPRKRSLPLGLLLALFFLLALGYGAYLLLRPAPSRVVEVAPGPAPQAPARHPLRVVSEPPGARVYLDGFYLGQTPLQSPPVEGGKRLIRLELPGYEAVEEEVLLEGPRSLSYRLRPLPQAPALDQPPPPAQGATGKLVLRLEGRSWLRVRQGEKRLYEGIPEVGAELSFDLPVEVRAGNPGAVRVILEGKDLGLMGEPGKPITRSFP
jgi:cytoskeleton protein RodZ